MTELVREAPAGLDQPPGRVPTSLLAGASVLAALGASSCCVVPLLLFSLGISGAWIGNLTALAQYQPIFVAVAVGLLAAGFVRVYGRVPLLSCAAGYCASPRSSRVTKAALWTAAFLVMGAAAFPYLARVLLET